MLPRRGLSLVVPFHPNITNVARHKCCPHKQGRKCASPTSKKGIVVLPGADRLHPLLRIWLKNNQIILKIGSRVWGHYPFHSSQPIQCSVVEVSLTDISLMEISQMEILLTRWLSIESLDLLMEVSLTRRLSHDFVVMQISLASWLNPEFVFMEISLRGGYIVALCSWWSRCGVVKPCVHGVLGAMLLNPSS